jgi:hypothetical protein
MNCQRVEIRNIPRSNIQVVLRVGEDGTLIFMMIMIDYDFEIV